MADKHNCADLLDEFERLIRVQECARAPGGDLNKIDKSALLNETY